jgi:hypothetical protein
MLEIRNMIDSIKPNREFLEALGVRGYHPLQPTDIYLSPIAGACYQGRDFCCTEQTSEALTTFLFRKPGQRGSCIQQTAPDTGRWHRVNERALVSEFAPHIGFFHHFISNVEELLHS